MAKRVGVDKWLFRDGAAAGAVRAGDGVFGFGGDGEGAVWVALSVHAEAGAVGWAGAAGAGGADEDVTTAAYNNPKVVFPLVAVTVLLLVACFRCGRDRTIRTDGSSFGGFFTFQPSELATPIVILFLAYFLQTRLHKMDDYKGTILRAVAASAAA